MKRIPTLFLRDPCDPKRLTDKINPEAAWLLTCPETLVEPSVKWDGTAMQVLQGRPWKRFTVKHGRRRPAGFDATGPSDEGVYPGWVPLGEGPEDRYHRQAWSRFLGCSPRDDGCLCSVGGSFRDDWSMDGTYELVGPKVQGNPYGLEEHMLVRHGDRSVPVHGLGLEELREVLQALKAEGIVWRNVVREGRYGRGLVPRYAKLKRRDFGLEWPCDDPIIPHAARL